MGSDGERIEHYSSNMRLLVDKVSDHPGLLDTSELLRPEAILKEKEAFRDYTKNDALGERVKRTYTEMHTKQTMAFVMEKHKTWLKFNHMEATIMEALDMLNELVDESDPDLDLPNIVHAFQTAERIREEHPDKEWFQLVGLIHDLGRSWRSMVSRSGQWWEILSPWVVSLSLQSSLARRVSRTTRTPTTPGTTRSWASTRW